MLYEKMTGCARNANCVYHECYG